MQLVDAAPAVAKHLATIKKAAFRGRLLNWYDKRARQLPWRNDWGRLRSPYTVWLSEIMLQQTVIKAVLPVYERFLNALPTVESLAAADEDTVRMLVRGLGYYRRFRFLHQGAKQVAASGTAQWPKSYSEWLELPGIGDYTASAISSIALNEPQAVIDGNVERVLCRVFDLELPPNLVGLKPILRRAAQELLEVARPGDFNQALMEVGQIVCTPTNPDCAHCPLTENCLAFAHSTQATSPAPKVKITYVDLQMRLLIPVANGKVGLLRRPPDAKFLRGELGFVTFVQDPAGKYQLDGSIDVKITDKAIRDHAKYKHSITKHRISAAVSSYDAKEWLRRSDVEWLEPAAVEERLLANLDRKAWTKYKGSDPLLTRWGQSGD